MTQKKYWTEVAQHNRKRHADIDRANRKPRQEEPGIRGKVYSIYKEKGIDGVKEFIKNNKGEFSGYSEEFAIKMLVQEIFIKEGMPGVIGFIECHKDEHGNYLYPGKIVDEWLKELAPRKVRREEEYEER